MKLSLNFKLELIVIVIFVVILFVATGPSKYNQLVDEMADLGCITDMECGCIDDCLEPAVLTETLGN